MNEPVVDECHNTNRIERMEHYVHGRGWWTRLIAWIGFGLIVAGAFSLQAHTISDLESTRRSSCLATITALEASQANASSGIRSLIVIPPNIDPLVHEFLVANRANTVKENALRRAVIKNVEIQEKRFLKSPYCDNVSHSEKHDLDQQLEAP